MKKYYEPDRNTWLQKLLRKGGWLAALIVTLGSLSAQDCTLACNGSLTAPLQVSVGDNCLANLLTDNILEAPQQCPGAKELIVRDSFSQVVVQGIDDISFSAEDYIGQVLSVTVVDTTTGLLCVGYILMADNVAPVFTSCPEQMAECVDMFYTDSLLFPVVVDNCDPEVALTFDDVFTAADCLSDTAGTLVRTWTATDSSGNFSHCDQLIYVLRPELDSIVFPPDLELLACDTSLVVVPDSTGWPTLDSVIILDGGLCDFTIDYQDDTTLLCGQTFQIQRRWTVASNCSGFVREETQLIQVRDTIAPSINCISEPLHFSTDAASCFATVQLPQPNYSDNCGGPLQVFVSTSYGATGFLPHPFVPVGTHTIQYTVIDPCGNSSVCSRDLIVTDQEAPTAVCEDQMVVGLPNTGLAVIDAINFDDGSSDNCSATVFYKARRMQTGGCNAVNGDDHDIPGYQEWFDDEVLFCCEEIGTQVQVILRVYEIDPGDGPVEAHREQPGGDLFGHFTECMLIVSVQDAYPPQLACPADVGTDCATDVSDLSIFGAVAVQDNCSFTLDSTVTTNLDECGRGTILREWIATDQSGLSNGCVQTITITNDNALQETDIDWPENYTSDVCGSPTDPEDLPDGFDFPNILIDGCGDIVYDYSDLHFDLDQVACLKILRTWTVLDWCHYNADTGTGQYTYTQIIKIRDNVKPVLSVPQSDIFPTTNCLNGQVIIPSATAQDCSAEVLITNDSPYADSHGANASGTYPTGTTVVTFTAADRCGNVSTKQIEINVFDNVAPEPVCIVGLSVNLADMNGEIKAMVSADAFDGGSDDPCTSDNDLIRTIRRPGPIGTTGAPTTTELAFTCDDKGPQLVEFWVTDAAGNSDYCLTVVDIQDNHNLCPTTVQTATIAGGILTEDGAEVEHVEVRVAGLHPAQIMTGLDGSFLFNNLPAGEDYTIFPVRNDNPLNGVSTFDLLLISKHLLNVQPLDSPYKIIAADVDRSGHVSTLDLIRLRKVILGIDTEFPNDNTSWRFVDADYAFPDPTDPWLTYFPELYNINDLDDDEMYADFVAIKVGDVNGTAQPSDLHTPSTIAARSTEEAIQFYTLDQEWEAGERVEVPIYGAYMNEIMGYQFTLEFDAGSLYLAEVKAGDLPNLYSENFGLVDPENGIITSLWNEYDVEASSEETLLFTLTFQASTAGKLSESLYLGSRITAAEAYQQDHTLRSLSLHFTQSATTDTQFELYQNRPNPFSNETIIPFQLAEAGVAIVSVYDMAGKKVHETEEQLDAGYNEIGIDRSHLPSTGLFYYTLRANGREATRKMVLTD